MRPRRISAVEPFWGTVLAAAALRSRAAHGMAAHLLGAVVLTEHHGNYAHFYRLNWFPTSEPGGSLVLAAWSATPAACGGEHRAGLLRGRLPLALQ